MILRRSSIAESRGPGARRNFEDSGDDYDLDLEQRNRGAGGRSGRIILLGDGTEVLTDSDETEPFDHEEEDKDLDSQVAKGNLTSTEGNRGVREETPGPQSTEKSPTSERNPFDTPSTTTSEMSEPTQSASPKVIPESALPDKLVTPTKTQEAK